MTMHPVNGGPHPQRGWLLAIDMQQAFCDPASSWHVPRYLQVEDQVKTLAEQYPMRTIWTRFVRDAREDGAWAAYYDRWSTFRVGPDSPVWDLTVSTSNDPVLTLPTFSKWGPWLSKLVADDEDLILCGVATDCCVLATALGAVDAGRSVTVVTDACAGVTDTAHNQALELMGLLSPMVSLQTTAEVLAARSSAA